MTPHLKLRTPVWMAAVAGLALRLFFVLEFPASGDVDSATYLELARNWLDHHVYGIWINGGLTPVDIRVPGYPAFLAAVSVFFGRSATAVLVAQVVVDLATCFLIAGLAARLAPESARRRVAVAALWLAALCPLTANYTATILTETLTVFLTALALLAFVEADAGEVASELQAGLLSKPWFLGSVVVGLATLVRPESPMLLMAVGLVLLWKCRHPRNWPWLLRTGVVLGAGFLLPLLPWAARNWRTLHEVQLLTPRYAQLPGEVVPRGFYAWTRSWLWRFRDVYLVPWKLDEETISIDDLPASAFDSPEERQRVQDLLAAYNENVTLTPELDSEFSALARERAARHPLRTWVVLPFLRAMTLWFTPRIELLPFSGHLWPPGEMWEDDPVDFSVTLGFGALAVIFAGMALAGMWRVRGNPGAALLIAFVVVRTAFFTQVETPEPRYVLECFPVILAFAAQLFARGGQKQGLPSTPLGA